MFFSVLCFLTGTLVVQQLTVLPDPLWIALLCLLFSLFSLLRYWKSVFFIAGLLGCIGFAHLRLADRLSDSLHAQLIQVEGQVIGLPHTNERRVRFNFEVLKATVKLPKKIRLSWFFPTETLKAGQFWQFTVKLKKPHGNFNQGGFDYERWLFIQNIGATGYVRNKPQPRLIKDPPLWQSISGIRQMIANKLNQLEAINNSGIIKALTIGERTEISNQQWDLFRKTGTVHLLAISGLHIGLISRFVYFLTLKIASRWLMTSPPFMAAIIATLMAIVYAALAGFSLPTQRALLMLSIAMLAVIWQRNITAINTLAMTLLIVLIIDPFVALSTGFWLSFIAVILIIYSFSGRLAKRGYWEGIIKIHCLIAIGIAPLLIYTFQHVSIISPIANFFAVPIVSLLVVPLCLIAVILLFITPRLAESLFLLVDNILQGLGWGLSKIAELPYASISSPEPPFYALILAFLGVFILLSPKGIVTRWLGIVLFFPLFFVENNKLKQGEVMMTLLDVGQGLSAVIETKNHLLIFDTGAKYSAHYNMGDAVVMPFLNSKGIKVIDILLISHGDNDHIGGAKSIIEQSQVKKILTSVPEKLAQYAPTLCQAGDSWLWDQVSFKLLSPNNTPFISENDNSCVLKVSSKQGSFLLTGDIEATAEQELVDHYPQQLASDVLVAPHHGSKTSSTLLFLKQVNPQTILIPSGYQNRYSFPHLEVLNRYKAINANVWNTADQGALTVKLKNNSVIVDSIRSEKSKYWNQ